MNCSSCWLVCSVLTFTRAETDGMMMSRTAIVGSFNHSLSKRRKSNTNPSSIILFRSDANPTYQITDCLWFGSVCVMFVSVLQIVYWTGRCDCTVNRNVNIFMAFLLFLSIVLVIAAASIFTANYGDQRCGSGDMEITCESEIFFLYGSPFPIRAMILYFKMQDLHWVR